MSELHYWISAFLFNNTQAYPICSNIEYRSRLHSLVKMFAIRACSIVRLSYYSHLGFDFLVLVGRASRPLLGLQTLVLSICLGGQ